MNKGKPPDIYKCQKQILKNVIKDDNKDFVLSRIKDTVNRTNKAVIVVYQFIKAFYLYQLKNKAEVPIIDKEYIKNCFLICCQKDKRGPPLS